MKKDEGGIWDLFKKLRKYPLENDQIGILLRRFGAGMSVRQTMEDMHWTSVDTYYRRYREAVGVLQKKGWKK